MPQNALNIPTTSTPAPNHQRLIAFVIIALCVIFAFTFKARLGRLTQLQAEIHMWETRTEEAKAHQASLYEQLLYVKSDEYVVAVAREELGLTQEGDELIVVVGGLETNTGLANTSNNASNSGTSGGIINPINVALNVAESSTALDSYSAARDFVQGETLPNAMTQDPRPTPIWEQWLALFFYPDPIR